MSAEKRDVETDLDRFGYDCLKTTHSFESSNVLRRGPREGEKKELRNRRGSPGCEKDFSFRCPVPLIKDMTIRINNERYTFLNYSSIIRYHKRCYCRHLGITGSCTVRSVFCASLEAVVPRGLIKHTDFVYRCLSCGRLEDYYVLEKDNFYQCLTLSCSGYCNVQTLDQSDQLSCCAVRKQHGAKNGWCSVFISGRCWCLYQHRHMVVWLYTSTFYSQELGFGSFGTIYQAKHKVRVQSSWLLKHFPKHLTQRNPAHRMIKFGASHWTAWCFSKMCNSSKAVGDQKAFGYDMNIWYEFVLWQLSIFIFQVSYISLSFHFSFHPHGFQPCVASVLGLQICGTLATKFFADLKWFSRRVDFLVVFDKVKKVPKAEDDEKLSLDLQICVLINAFFGFAIWFVFEVFGIETWWDRWFGW